MSLALGWQAKSLGLTAPELQVLIANTDGDARQVFKLALMELLTGDVLERTTVLHRPANAKADVKVGVLRPGSNYDAPLSRSLGVLRDLHKSIPSQMLGGVTGVPVPDFTRAAARRWGNLQGYARNEVMPVLLARGFYRAEEYRIMWVIPATRYVLTHEGQQARDKVLRVLAEAGQNFGGWAANQPATAAQFLAGAGPAALLLPNIYPDIQRLGEAEEAALQQTAQVRHIDWDEIGELIDVVGDICNLVGDFSDVSAGVDSGDSGGGGDGGGGDGGCGGGCGGGG